MLISVAALIVFLAFILLPIVINAVA